MRRGERTRKAIRTSRAGASRLGVCVTLGCLLLLIALGLPAIQQSRETERRQQCKNRLKEVSLALMNNHDVDRSFPPGSTSRASWQAYILCFLVSNNWYMEVDPRSGVAPTDHRANVENFLCPSNVEATNLDGETTYLAASGRQDPRDAIDPKLRGVFRDETYDADGILRSNTDDPSSTEYRGWKYLGNYFNFRDATDGTDRTICVGETARGGIRRWCPPFDPAKNATIAGVTGRDSHINAIADSGVRSPFSSEHPGGAQFVAVDGSVHFLNQRIDPALFAAFLTIAGGEDVDLPR